MNTTMTVAMVCNLRNIVVVQAKEGDGGVTRHTIAGEEKNEGRKNKKMLNNFKETKPAPGWKIVGK